MVQVRCRYGAGTRPLPNRRLDDSTNSRPRPVHSRPLPCRYGAGTLQVRCRYGAGTLQVRCRYAAGTLQVRRRYDAGMVQVRCMYGADTVQVLCRYAAGTVQVRCRHAAGTLTSLGVARALPGMRCLKPYQLRMARLLFSTCAMRRMATEALLWLFSLVPVEGHRRREATLASYTFLYKESLYQKQPS